MKWKLKILWKLNVLGKNGIIGVVKNILGDRPFESIDTKALIKYIAISLNWYCNIKKAMLLYD